MTWPREQQSHHVSEAASTSMRQQCLEAQRPLNIRTIWHHDTKSSKNTAALNVVRSSSSICLQLNMWHLQSQLVQNAQAAVDLCCYCCRELWSYRWLATLQQVSCCMVLLPQVPQGKPGKPGCCTAAQQETLLHLCLNARMEPLFYALLSVYDGSAVRAC